MDQAIEGTKAIELALGRILRIAARPFEEGDYDEYDRCRAIIMEAAEDAGINPRPDSIGHLRQGWNFGNAVLD